ncbi:ORF6N domain-containing protein [Sulfurimonas sp.]|uniref:ORF6N domain-containing protein n=1 Tax=Sulfurimonas sp. TaxID=2022749 RepID=UPI003561E5FF
MNDMAVINEETIKNKIYSICGFQVMLDRDLAELYGVETKVLNQKEDTAYIKHVN